MDFCFYLEIDFPDALLSQTEQRCFLIYLSKGKNKEVHKSQISSGVLDSCAEPLAMPGRGQFCLPGLLLLQGGKLRSLQALPAHEPAIATPQRLFGDVCRLICIFLMACDANTLFYQWYRLTTVVH